VPPRNDRLISTVPAQPADQGAVETVRAEHAELDSIRTGKATISADLAGILDRLGTSVANGQARMEKLRQGRLFGRFFAASRKWLPEVAGRLGVRSVWNLDACPAR
jgi:hypothetical protein